MKAFFLLTVVTAFMLMAMDAVSSACWGRSQATAAAKRKNNSATTKAHTKNNIIITRAFFISKYSYSL